MEREMQNNRESWRDRRRAYGSEGGGGEAQQESRGEYGIRQEQRRREPGESRDGGEWGAGGWGFGTGPGSTSRENRPERTLGPGGYDGTQGQWDPQEHSDRRSQWWGAGQSFAGRGPKGYRRSDDRIREEICDRLTDDPRIDAREVTIRVENGEVTLEGSVCSRHEKREAEHVCDRIAGVQDVHNHLHVARQESGRDRDLSIEPRERGGMGDLGTGPQGTTAGARTP